MSYCRVCGTSEGLAYRERSGLTLCGFCHKETPRKASRSDFDLIYWEGKADVVHWSTRQSFWEDYKTSSIGPVTEYMASTISEVY